ncbi:MAG TPA: hypothetical protein VF193_07055 [Steroidobacter sp.]|jgi:hypothetical protein
MKRKNEEPEKTFWFPAKRRGWGWGPPVRWQGWLVIVIYVGLLAIGAFRFLPSENVAGFLMWGAGLTLVLVFICWVKGEPPGWRWEK